eukprot:763627-Hanusia_phi.AAC.10
MSRILTLNIKAFDLVVLQHFCHHRHSRWIAYECASHAEVQGLASEAHLVPGRPPEGSQWEAGGALSSPVSRALLWGGSVSGPAAARQVMQGSRRWFTSWGIASVWGSSSSSSARAACRASASVCSCQESDRRNRELSSGRGWCDLVEHTAPRPARHQQAPARQKRLATFLPQISRLSSSSFASLASSPFKNSMKAKGFGLLRWKSSQGKADVRGCHLV